MARAQRIRTRANWAMGGYFIAGLLHGEKTDIAVRRMFNGNIYPVVVLKGHRLYRLAKAIVRQFEEVGDD